MCVNQLARIVDLDEDRRAGAVEQDGKVLRVSLAVVDGGTPVPAPGDWVLMHAGIPIQVIGPAEAAELRDLQVQLASQQN